MWCLTPKLKVVKYDNKYMACLYKHDINIFPDLEKQLNVVQCKYIQPMPIIGVHIHMTPFYLCVDDRYR